MLTLDKLASHNQDHQMPPPGNQAQEISFADLLEYYDLKPPQRGDYVKGEILQIKDNVILINVDAKRTAVVPPQDLERLAEEELAELAVGAEVTLYVLRTPEGDEDLFVSLSKGFEHQDWLDAQAYMEDEELLELEVIGHNKGGLVVAFGHLQGFVPTSHIPQLGRIYDQRSLIARKAEMVGDTLPLQVIEVNSQRRRLILSAKKAQSMVQQRRLAELKLKVEESITGQVTSLVKFGAFVDLAGAEGLVHISEIAWQKVADPAEFLSPGEDVEVLIQSVNLENGRISLSRKALLPSPWDAFAESHAIGQLIEGVVTNVVDFGAFLAVAEGIEGLIHVSEMHGTQSFDPQDVLQPGDTILVRILDIQPEQQRLALSQRRISQEDELQWIWQRQEATALAAEEEE